MQDLQLPFDERRPFALRRLRDRIEANLSGLRGPSVAQDLVGTFGLYKAGSETYVTEDIHFIESRLEEYRSRLTGLPPNWMRCVAITDKPCKTCPWVCAHWPKTMKFSWNRALEDPHRDYRPRVVGSRLDSIDAPA